MQICMWQKLTKMLQQLFIIIHKCAYDENDYMKMLRKLLHKYACDENKWKCYEKCYINVYMTKIYENLQYRST